MHKINHILHKKLKQSLGFKIIGYNLWYKLRTIMEGVRLRFPDNQILNKFAENIDGIPIPNDFNPDPYWTVGLDPSLLPTDYLRELKVMINGYILEYSQRSPGNATLILIKYHIESLHILEELEAILNPEPEPVPEPAIGGASPFSDISDISIEHYVGDASPLSGHLSTPPSH